MTTFPKYDPATGCLDCAGKPGYDEARETAMVEIQGVYDGGLFYSCSCGSLFHRFSSDHHLYAKAQEVMQRWHDRRPSPPF